MKILYISYFYPPLGGPAALRNQKTVKYLSELGCIIDVISVKDIEYNYIDDSLLQACKEHRIIRTGSWDPMALLKKFSGAKGTVSKQIYHGTPERLKLLIRRLYPLDDKIGWLPHLYLAGRKAFQSNAYDLIYVSCRPFSSALAARWLSRRFKVPYVLEMRDYWTLLSDYNLQGNGLNRFFAQAWEKRLLHDAALIVTATKGIADDLSTVFGTELADKTMVLYNGHDEADFLDFKLLDRTEKSFVLSYFGALYARRSLKALFAAVKDLQDKADIVIKLYGNYHIETEKEIEQSGIADRIHIIPQLSHKMALQQMSMSDALLLVINSGSPKGTLTSKVFEYLRTGKPILALVPQNSEAAELLAESGQDFIAPMESRAAIKNCLIKLIADKDHSFHYPAQIYERKSQIAQLYKRLAAITLLMR